MLENLSISLFWRPFFFLSFALVQLTFAGSERARRLKSKKLLIRKSENDGQEDSLYLVSRDWSAQFTEV
jgi:hypothetical protein